MNISKENVNNYMQNIVNRNKSTCSDSALDKSELMKKIQTLAFAKTETELYLDAHPDTAAAMDYYKDVTARLLLATEEYEAKYGPITASSAVGDRWAWIDGKWPWQYDPKEDV